MWHLTLKKSCVAQHGDLFDKVFYIDIYRVCFILLLLLLLLLLNIIDSLNPPLTKKPSEEGYWKLNKMPGSSECLIQKHQFLNWFIKILLLHWIQLCLLLTLNKSMLFELSVLIPLVLYLIRSVSAEVSLNYNSRIRFRCSFFWQWDNQYMVHGFDSNSIAQFPVMICTVSAEGSLNCVDFEQTIFVYFVRIWCLFTTQFILVIAVQIWAACSESLTVILYHFILVLLSSTLMK